MMAFQDGRALTLLALMTAAALTACGSRAARSGDSLDAADLAVTRAEQARVADYAAADLRAAREKLAAARDAARRAEATQDGKLATQASWLAEEARVDAELATARAQQAKINAVLLQKQRGLDGGQP